MALAAPAFATVRPRVVVTRTGESHLLEDLISEIASEYTSGVVRVIGGPGSGKSTALAHLAATFAHDDHILLLDDPTNEQLQSCPNDRLVVARLASAGSGLQLELRLLPWGTDELIEYALVAHHDRCNSIIKRFGAASTTTWVPELACAIIDRFANDESVEEPIEALVQVIYDHLRSPKQQVAVEEFCLLARIGNVQEWEDAWARLSTARVPEPIRRLLYFPIVQLPLAARFLVSGLKVPGRRMRELDRIWPGGLIDEVGRRCAGREEVTSKLRGLLASRWSHAAHSMAASILCVAEPDWQPEPPRRPWHFRGGVFAGAQWHGVNLFRADLRQADFTAATLSDANLENANAESAVFAGAMLTGSTLIKLNGAGADFRQSKLTRALLASSNLARAWFNQADLSNADLTSAELSDADLSRASFRNAKLRQVTLVGATLVDTDFTGADLSKANLFGADLRNVNLEDACLEGAKLRGVQWEDSHLTKARLCRADLAGAHLTGTAFPFADLSEANLQSTGLAEIEWEGANLSGADLRFSTFHMGSSRSGLVGSTIACEGSKTGFYTDDFEDMNFKRPEEIRKANLRGADLRGVRADGVDFYLVDLRDAKLDATLLKQARATGAILCDRET